MDRHANVILVQPLGVRDEIFPWGLHFIGDYLSERLSNVTVSPLFLQRDNEFAKLLSGYGKVGESLLSLLSREAQQPFGGPGGSGAAYDLTVYGAWQGSRLIFRFRDHDCYAPGGFRTALSQADDLDILRRLFLKLLDDRLDDLIRRTKDGLTIVGMSVYDRTLFFCLSLADRIRNRFPNIKIILGGDYFTFESASVLMRNCSLVDGVVVGYGEEVMRQIVEGLQHGRKVENLFVQGLMNTNSLRRPEIPPPIFPDRSWVTAMANDKDRLQVINIPSNYIAADKSVIQFVRFDASQSNEQFRTLRVMLQRGCSYGKCTFCTQLDKKLYFRLSHQDILSDLAEKLAGLKGDSPVLVRFDADEHAPKAMIDIMEFFCSDAIRDDVEIFVRLWFQAKYMGQKIAKPLASLRNKRNVHLIFVMNFETLNPTTLGLMDKGHSALTALFGAKVIQDSGQYFETNYMEYFPGETEADVAEEYQLLHSALHLIAGKVNLFPYSINGRDDVYQNPQKYGVRSQAFAKDLWLRDIFGLDLPSSIWNYGLDLVEASDTTRSWQQYLSSRNESTKAKFDEAVHRENAVGYLQRSQDFAWLHSVRSRSVLLPPPISMKIVKRTGMPASIHKDYAASTGAETEVKWLCEEELTFLRFIYQPRTWAEVLDRFYGSVPENTLISFRESNQVFGSIVEHSGLLLSTVNDPGHVLML